MVVPLVFKISAGSDEDSEWVRFPFTSAIFSSAAQCRGGPGMIGTTLGGGIWVVELPGGAFIKRSVRRAGLQVGFGHRATQGRRWWLRNTGCGEFCGARFCLW